MILTIKQCKNVLYLYISTFLVKNLDCKYIEGELKTRENWAFLARFCFLSEDGQFEYHIEFNEDQGDPNLLLYYDTNDQWPAVYKSNKSCQEREAVLNIGQNQIVNLTTRYPQNREFSGCSILPRYATTPAPKYTLNIPKLTTPTSKVKKATKSGIITTRILETTTRKSISPSTIFITSQQETFSTSQYIPSSTTPISIEDIYSTITFETVPVSLIIEQNTENQGENTAENVTENTENAEKIATTTENVKMEYEFISKSLIKTTKASFKKDNNNQHPIKKRYVPVAPPIRSLRIGRYVQCHNARRFRSSRERWWFIAVSNCNGTKGINIKYKLLMTNGPPGDYWHEHFSADEFYILPVLMGYAIAHSFLMLGIVVCSVELKQRQLLHSTYKIFVFSVILQVFGILFHSVVYLKYAVTGLSANKLKRFGSMLMGASETSFLLLLLLLAKGYTITRGKLPVPASIKLTIFMCLYTVTYISIFIYEAKVFDPGEVLYLYESPAGYGLITLRIFAWFMFIYSTVFTLKRYPEKGNFYYPFNVFGTLWFVAGPAFILSANTYIDKWVRESVVCAILLFITFGGHLSFLVLTMPSVANKNFPYHVRTTQIGIMELTNGVNGSSTIENFGHHVYEPTVYTTTREQALIIPLTRRTEEIYEGMYSQTAFKRRPRPETTEQIQNGSLNEELQNAMTWSLAKNITATSRMALELPKFENGLDSENDPDTSLPLVNHNTDNELRNDSETQRSNSELCIRRDSMEIERRFSNVSADSSDLQNTLKAQEGYLSDYVKDVPIELFTVSKMVITTNRRKSSIKELE